MAEIKQFPKPGTAENPKRPQFDKRPNRFTEPIFSKVVCGIPDSEHDEVRVVMYLRLTKRERLDKMHGLIDVIQEYFDSGEGGA